MRGPRSVVQRVGRSLHSVFDNQFSICQAIMPEACTMKTAWCYFTIRLRQKTNEAYILDLMLILMKIIFIIFFFSFSYPSRLGL